jgi:hypothetical protein
MSNGTIYKHIEQGANNPGGCMYISISIGSNKQQTAEDAQRPAPSAQGGRLTTAWTKPPLLLCLVLVLKRRHGSDGHAMAAVTPWFLCQIYL